MGNRDKLKNACIRKKLYIQNPYRGTGCMCCLREGEESNSAIISQLLDDTSSSAQCQWRTEQKQSGASHGYVRTIVSIGSVRWTSAAASPASLTSGSLLVLPKPRGSSSPRGWHSTFTAAAAAESEIAAAEIHGGHSRLTVPPTRSDRTSGFQGPRGPLAALLSRYKVCPKAVQPRYNVCQNPVKNS